MTAVENPSDAAALVSPPRQLIVSLYGLYARQNKGWLSVAAVVRLMAELGVDGQAVRSSISRLKRRGLLVARRVDGAAGYALSPVALDILADGDARIFGRRRATIADGWLLVVFSVPESERDKRHQLRAQLTRLGFGTVAPGVWVAPGHLETEANEVLERLGVTAYAEVFRGQHVAFGDLPEQREPLVGPRRAPHAVRRLPRPVPPGPGALVGARRRRERHGLRRVRRDRDRVAAAALRRSRDCRSSCCRRTGTASRPRSCSRTCGSCSPARRECTPGPSSPRAGPADRRPAGRHTVSDSAGGRMRASSLPARAVGTAGSCRSGCGAAPATNSTRRGYLYGAARLLANSCSSVAPSPAHPRRRAAAPRTRRRSSRGAASGRRHDRALGDVGVAHQHLLHLGAGDVVAGGDDHVVAAGLVDEVALGVADVGVAGHVPAVPHDTLVCRSSAR